MAKNILVKSLVTAVATTFLTLPATSAFGAKPPEMDKCYGVAKAGKNDCGSKNSNACSGQAKVSRDPHAWILVPKGTCDKIEGGSTHPPETQSN